MLESIETWLFQYLPEPIRNKYIVAAIIFICFALLSKFFVFIAETIILALAKKTSTKLDDIIVERTNKPISWLIIFIGLRLSLEYLASQTWYGIAARRLADSLTYIAAGVILIAVLVALIDHWAMAVSRKTNSVSEDALIPLFKKTTTVGVMIIVSITVLALWGVNITGLLAGVGIAGIAIGFAVKDTLANIFGGVSLIFDKAFTVGDQIALDDGTTGTVKAVGIRSTRITTLDNELVIVPNGTLSNMKIKNFNLPEPKQRISIPFGIEYGADPEKVKRLVLSEIKNVDGILKDPEPQVLLNDMGDSALNMKAFFWIDDFAKAGSKKDEATYRIYSVLNKNKVGIPYPTRTVHLKR